MIKSYFQLVRFPGVFTAFSNILIGYFFLLQYSSETYPFPFLLITTGMLFSAGMLFNDYFDLNADKKERPTRPLPSGKISKQNTLFLGISLLIIGNIFSIFSGYYSLILSLIMTVLILFYNYKAKSYYLIGIFCLALIRFLNVFLGFSTVQPSLEIIQFSIPIAIFVSGISIIAKNEINSIKIKPFILNKILNIITIFYVFTLIINYLQMFSLFWLSLFSLLSLNLKMKNKNFNQDIQKKITLQLLSIILLDATLVSIFSSFYHALVVSLLIIPAYVITRKLYLT
jgi:4-hydroxybenzoate polyprenyltransferase